MGQYNHEKCTFYYTRGNGRDSVPFVVLYAAGAERRRIALVNLALCFPQLSSRSRKRIARTHFMVLARSMLERGILWWSSADAVRRLVRLEGEAQRVGNGTARAYILVDERDASVPVEVGVALSEGVMEGLPKPAVMDHSKMTGDMEHVDAHNWILELPAKNPTRYQFVQFGWNPKGHEPPGVWDVPHFDFHFYTIDVATKGAILPGEGDVPAENGEFAEGPFAERAMMAPEAGFLPASYAYAPGSAVIRPRLSATATRGTSRPSVAQPRWPRSRASG